MKRLGSHFTNLLVTFISILVIFTLLAWFLGWASVLFNTVMSTCYWLINFYVLLTCLQIWMSSYIKRRINYRQRFPILARFLTDPTTWETEDAVAAAQGIGSTLWRMDCIGPISSTSCRKLSINSTLTSRWLMLIQLSSTTISSNSLVFGVFM